MAYTHSQEETSPCSPSFYLLAPGNARPARGECCPCCWELSQTRSRRQLWNDSSPIIVDVFTSLPSSQRHFLRSFFSSSFLLVRPKPAFRTVGKVNSIHDDALSSRVFAFSFSVHRCSSSRFLVFLLTRSASGRGLVAPFAREINLILVLPYEIELTYTRASVESERKGQNQFVECRKSERRSVVEREMEGPA